VLHGINLEVRAGEIVALVGPNGAGKSTLVRAITGVTPLSAGTVRLDGADLLRLRPAERLGAQRPATLAHERTVAHDGGRSR
jgi:branched-chain amino acid transport system ATP-binding protein